MAAQEGGSFSNALLAHLGCFSFQVRRCEKESLSSTRTRKRGLIIAMMTPAKQARLIVLANGQPIPLAWEVTLVGRQDPTLGIFPEINLADNTVAGRHACLRNDQGTFTVENVASLHLTRLNGTDLPPHQEHLLTDGDILHFGAVALRFELY